MPKVVTVTDHTGRVLGNIIGNDGESKIGRSTNKYVGTYIRASDMTVDENNRMVSQGDCLDSLIRRAADC